MVGVGGNHNDYNLYDFANYSENFLKNFHMSAASKFVHATFRILLLIALPGSAGQ